MTRQTVQVLDCLRANATDDLYGLLISDHTGLPTGTVYPILDRLVDAGLITEQRETTNTLNPKRPPRRLFKITGTGLMVLHASEPEVPSAAFSLHRLKATGDG